MKEQGFATKYPDMARKRCGNQEFLKWIEKGLACGIPIGLLVGILTNPELGFAFGGITFAGHVLLGISCVEDSRRPRM